MPSSGDGRGPGPGHVFAVAGAVDEAAVEDADEPVGQGAERLVVRLAVGPVGVVGPSGAGGGTEGGESPQGAGVGEVAVARHAGERSRTAAIRSNGRPNVSCRTNASRSADVSVSSTTSGAGATASATSASRSGSTPPGR